MKRLVLCGLLLFPLTGCTLTRQGAALNPFLCRSDLVKGTTSQLGKGQIVSTHELDAVFGRLDTQPQVEVRETGCDSSIESLRYIKPHRMQFVAWLNSGTARRSAVLRDPRETQIGDRLGYIGHVMLARWVGVGLTAHRMLLPDAWRGATENQRFEPAFYLVSPPNPPIRNLTVRSFTAGKQRLFVERWRGLLYRCPPGVSCPAPNTDPRFFARYTAVLRVDRSTGLPVSLTIVAQPRGRDRGRFVWGKVQPVAQTAFLYGGRFSIHFVKN